MGFILYPAIFANFFLINILCIEFINNNITLFNLSKKTAPVCKNQTPSVNSKKSKLMEAKI